MKQNIVFLGKRFFVMICIAGMVVGFSACEKPNNKGPRETGTGEVGGNGNPYGNGGGGDELGGGSDVTEPQFGTIKFVDYFMGVYPLSYHFSVTLSGYGTKTAPGDSRAIEFTDMPKGTYSWSATRTMTVVGGTATTKYASGTVKLNGSSASVEINF